MSPDVAMFMGGNGPDYDAWVGARRLQSGLTVSSSFEIAQGIGYDSPPRFLPGLPERYRPRQ
jgi:hypothetical protein